VSNLVVGVISSVLLVGVAVTALVLKVRDAHRIADDLLAGTGAGTGDLADPRPVPTRFDATAIPWAGEPGPRGDWMRVWVSAAQPMVLGHEPRNAAYTRCGVSMVDDRGRMAGALMPAGVAYERLAARWCRICYPPARIGQPR
jgi:hypothetical protein